MLSLIYFNYRLPFPSIDYYLSISSYLVSLRLTTQSNKYKSVEAIFYTSLSNVGGNWAGIDNHRCSLLFWSCYPLGTDKTSGKCILFLQSTPQQNWILLSVYHNRSENLCAAVTIHVTGQ